jgi:exodeoxyribonuclease VII large subunit
MNDFGGGAPFAESKSSSEQAPWSVAQLSGVLKDWIEKLGTLWVEGEIAQISRQGTRVFGELRDLNSETAWKNR